MPQCQFLFSAVFRFRKATQEIFSELDEINSSDQYFHRDAPGVRRGAGGEPRGPHTMPGRGPAWARAQPVVWGPSRPPAPALRLYIPPRRENPNTPDHIPRKVPSPPSSSTLDREGSEALPGTLPEGRSSPEASTSPCLPPE